ncbi:ADP-ribose pyrophosphatase [Trueperella bonasi]|uniref:ADP-ribose pyrophosphatase n=1 Tax=Trueperella bonasi TaxID=312286 RepID=A0ABT9NDV0_9ACTO|nr:NUDIX hydrolase [Trueperella bonasi]MDP9805562.1 ADP-ribose pyrophosphatase [Trueperella bonasi]
MYELCDTPVPDHVRLAERVERFAGPIFTIYDDEIEFASGDVVRRQWMDHDDAVAVVALKPSDHDEEEWDVLLIRQYRHAPRRLMWEIPAGLRDQDGEAEVLTAARELREETDFGASTWFRLVNFVTSPGVSNEDLGIFLAVDVEHAPLGDFKREAEEAEIAVEWFGLDRVTDAVMAGKLTSPTLVTGILAVNVALNRGLDCCEKIALPIADQ